YYFKVPQDFAERLVIVVDPMLATGNSAAAAVKRLKQEGAQNIKFVCLLAAPEGVRHLLDAHPDLHIYTAAAAELPVASIGSTTMTRRSAKSCGTLK
ncbi:MAG: hypothetical protein D6826_04105, partial [Alphaproteobacteria bacterium]